MNILLYGATETGCMVASQLYRKYNITIVDDLDSLPERFNNLDVGFVAGNGHFGPMASFGKLADLGAQVLAAVLVNRSSVRSIRFLCVLTGIRPR